MNCVFVLFSTHKGFFKPMKVFENSPDPSLWYSSLLNIKTSIKQKGVIQLYNDLYVVSSQFRRL